MSVSADTDPTTAADILLDDLLSGAGYSYSSMRECMVDLHSTLRSICERFQLGTTGGFRTFLKQASAVVSGSTALLPFHIGAFESNDLDIYAPASSRAIVATFMRANGYRITYGPEWYTSDNPSIRIVRRYKHKTHLSIDIIYSTSNSALQVIAEFHSTLVMNYIAHYGAVCLYPRLTLSKVGIVNSTNNRAPACYDKYRERGFRFVESSKAEFTHVCKVDCICPSTVRSIHDGSVLYIPFRGVEGRLSDHEDNLTWRLNNNTCGGSGWGFTVGHRGYAQLSWGLPVTGV